MTHYTDIYSGGSKGGARDAPPRSKFFQFHAVFGQIWQNRMLAPPTRGVGAPSSGKSWICHWCMMKWWYIWLYPVIAAQPITVAISAISNSFEILNVLTTIHSFSSKQWLTLRQYVYELSNWHNTQLICVKHVRISWMTTSSVRISPLLLFQPRAIRTLFMGNSFNDIWELSHHVLSCLFRRLYINQCKFHMFISFINVYPLAQHVLPRTTTSTT